MSSRILRQTTCTNCGHYGHHFRSCEEPITSYGIIAFRINQPSWNQAVSISKNDTVVIEPNIEYLLIQRKDSIGYVELIRAKYKLTELAYIREQITGLTAEEKQSLKTRTFYELWTGLWGPMNTPENRQYKQEFEQARTKFEALRAGIEIEGVKYTLEGLLQELPTLWKTPEWGFPKGRRNPQESDYECAVREFCEETSLKRSQFHIFENMSPIRETFRGNNDIQYSHVYYLAWIPMGVEPSLQPTNEHMAREIGNIGWFSFQDALKVIRSTTNEKREVLKKSATILRNVSPLLIGPLASYYGQNQPSVQIRSRDKNESDGGQQQQIPVWGEPGKREPGNIFSNKQSQQNDGQLIRSTITITSTITTKATEPTEPTEPAEQQWITRTSKPRDRFKRGTFSFVEE